MSWCRWSTHITPEITSDLYIYDSVYDYVQIHVAGRKRIAIDPTKIPPEPKLELVRTDIDKYMKLHNADMEFWDEKNKDINFTWQPIQEKWAGKSLAFSYSELDSMEHTLTEMRADGLNFPDHIYDILKETKEEYAKH